MPSFSERIYNFSAGPAALPQEVLEKAQRELLNFENTGMSVMEMSHRSATFESVFARAKEKLRDLLKIPEDFEILFLQGGARHQFAMAPLNFCRPTDQVDFIHTGHWTKLAMDEVNKVATSRIVASSEDKNFSYLPVVKKEDLSTSAAYLHYCSNNTITGTQWKDFVRLPDVPVVCDMSSDILSRKIDFNDFDLIYAGAQKNLGPSGVTLVLLRQDLAEKGNKKLPAILQYRSHIHANSMYNTPPTFAIYLVGLVLDWVEKQGGVSAIERQNEEKAKLLYSKLDDSDSFYSCPIRHSNDRSLMNIVFRIQNGHEELEKTFVQEAEAKGLSGLKGHRIVGGLRASIYNVQPIDSVKALLTFMDDFQEKHQ